jgi:hypothetical protein
MPEGHYVWALLLLILVAWLALIGLVTVIVLLVEWLT